MTPPVVVARKVEAEAASRDDFTYTILKEPVRTTGGERRAGVRRRTRLRSGKVMDADGRFLVECLIANRSAQGGLLRLPAAMPMPARILLYEDQSGELLTASIIWRRDRQIGIRFGTTERSAKLQALAASMRRKFYAVAN